MFYIVGLLKLHINKWLIMNTFQATCLMYFKTWYHDVYQIMYFRNGFIDMKSYY